jgi:hypothetical protein
MESRNSPGVAQKVPGGLGSQISWHSTREGGKVVSLTHRSSLPRGSIPGIHFHHGLSRPQGRGPVGRKYVTEKCSNTTENRSRGSPTSSAAP